MVLADISTDREENPLMERMEWDRLVGQMYRDLRRVTARPGRIIVYELANDQRQALVMQLLPRDQEWKEEEIICGVMQGYRTPTWGVSSLPEGYIERSAERRRVRARVVREADLASYMRGY